MGFSEFPSCFSLFLQNNTKTIFKLDFIDSWHCLFNYIAANFCGCILQHQGFDVLFVVYNFVVLLYRIHPFARNSPLLSTGVGYRGFSERPNCRNHRITVFLFLPAALIDQKTDSFIPVIHKGCFVDRVYCFFLYIIFTGFMGQSDSLFRGFL